MADRPTPADQFSELVNKRPADEPRPKQMNEWHTFLDKGYSVLLLHRGAFIQRLSAWTARGASAANDAAVRAIVHYEILEGDQLAVIVVRVEQEYERLYVGDGPNPSYYPGSDKPQIVPLYLGYGYSRRIKHVEITWSSDKERWPEGKPMPTEYWQQLNT